MTKESDADDQAFAGDAARREPRPGALSTLHRSQRATSRDAILKAANAYLASKPFDDITIEDILVSATVSRATFYRQFKSKYDVALNARFHQRLRQDRQ